MAADTRLGAIATAVAGDQPVGTTLDALVALRALRDQLDEWEPQLVAAARAAGASWAQIAPALGVASRQAAERRFLRLHRPGPEPAEVTRDERVAAVRDQRAGDRAVDVWARAHGADLRQLAGQISALTDLDPEARGSLDRLHDALGGNDAAPLVAALAAAGEHLLAGHERLANRVAAVTAGADEIRRDARDRRTPTGRRTRRET